MDVTVSVVIPCFNQGRFLRDAIESALRQEACRPEVIVVDDGSTDGSGLVAGSYEGVRVVSQRNGGLASARNAGLGASCGDVLIFLDADDRLRAGAARAAVDALSRAPDAMMAFGRCQLIDAGGQPLPTNILSIRAHFYEELLRRNYIFMPAMAAYRRAVFDIVGGFDVRRSPAADYEMYLRIARRFPLAPHDAVVAEYRRHDASMSRDAVQMLDATLRVLRDQRPFVGGDPRLRRAWREGMCGWRAFYGERLVARFRAALRTGGKRAEALWWAHQLLRWYPAGVLRHLWRKGSGIMCGRPAETPPQAGRP